VAAAAVAAAATAAVVAAAVAIAGKPTEYRLQANNEDAADPCGVFVCAYSVKSNCGRN
jgi:hypothetical protein